MDGSEIEVGWGAHALPCPADLIRVTGAIKSGLLKTVWKKAGVWLPEDQLAALDRNLQIVRVSRNAWLRDLIDREGAKLERRAKEKLRALGIRPQRAKLAR